MSIAPRGLLKQLGSIAVFVSFFAVAACNGSGQSSQPANDNGTSVTTPTTPPDNGPDNDNVVLLGARFYTVNDAQPKAQALAYDKNGVIIAVGNEAEVKAAAGDGASVKDLQGAFVMPGFQDLHSHIIEAGLEQTRCVIPPTTNESQLEGAVLDCVDMQAGKDWVFGAGARVEELVEALESPLAFLDALVPNKPVVIVDAVGHGAWANSRALEAVGYLTATSDPQGGIIDRFEDGTPTGIVYENAQQKLRTAALPPTAEHLNENYQGLKLVLEILAENGITTVGDAGGYWPRGHEKAWVQVEDGGGMTVRASNTLYVFPDRDFKTQMDEVLVRKTQDASRLAQFDQVKIYVDGIPEFGTAAMYEPYTQNPGVVFGYPKGFEYFDPQELVDYTVAFDKAGFQVHFHATGDRGVGIALDAVAEARRINGSGKAHRITHCIIVDPRDHTRFKELNVVADMQISPATTTPDDLPFYREIIGDRTANLYPAASLIAAGAEVILSSDWSADKLPPLEKLEAAVTRQVEAVPDLASAVRMMTLGPAKLIGKDAVSGSLEVGKQADLVVLDQDIFQITASKIDETKVLGTVMGGRVVYDRAGLFD